MIAHNPDELVAVVDENDSVVGTDTRENVHKKGLLHREIAVIVFNKKNEILLQKRKDNGRYGFSAAGHFSTTENYLQGAIRETKEEIGIGLKKNDLKEIAKLRRDAKWDGLRNNVFLEIFKTRKDFKIKDFKIDKYEVESIKFFSIGQIEKLVSESPENFGRGFRKVFEQFYKNG
ncbi:MAG: NUDIX domain-containing protein [Candidatus Aenigmatarchaeota archaeon]